MPGLTGPVSMRKPPHRVSPSEVERVEPSRNSLCPVRISITAGTCLPHRKNSPKLKPNRRFVRSSGGKEEVSVKNYDIDVQWSEAGAVKAK